MEIHNYKGLPFSAFSLEKIIINSDNVKSWEIKMLKGWKSPNLCILFIDGRYFENVVGCIVNYDLVKKYLKKELKHKEIKI